MAHLMATLLKRFRRKPAEDGPTSEGANTTSAGNESPKAPGGDKIDPEKHDPEVARSGEPTVAEAEKEEHLPEDIRELPKIVRNTVSLEDDPTQPTITFRYFLLAFLFTPPGAILYQMGAYRTTASAYPVLFVQIASHYVGLWLTELLPKRTFRVPFTKLSFSLNPGPWNSKEHVLVTVTAASGATSNAAWAPISLAQLYYGTYIPAAACIFFMWAIVFIGYAMAALARQFLLYDPIYTWPYALMQTAVFETMRKSARDSWAARKQKYVFFGALGFIIIWHSLSLLCWIAPTNPVANFVGAGIGSMGFLNLSLDWANISNQMLTNPMVVPFWTTTVLTVAFVFNCWILLPAAKYGNLGEWKHALMSNRVFLENGTRYPVTALVTPQNTFNETAYQQYGPVYMALTWMALFGYPQIRATYQKLRMRVKHKDADTVNYSYTDRLNVLQRSYKEVPPWWYIALFMVSFVTIITIPARGYFFIPTWTFFVAIFTFQVAIGSFNELVYGFMVHAGSGHRHPAGATAYGSIAGDIWYRAQYMLQDQKIGHYMHVPPRSIFFSQIFGELLGVPINYGIIQWVLQTKGEYLLGNKKDSLNQWTGQLLANYNTMGVQYVLIGPKRLFAQHMYKPLPWAFLYGAGAPLVLYILHRLWPKSKLKFHLWNVTIFGSGVAQFYGNLSTGYLSRLIVGYISMRWFFWHRFETWKRYNFLIAAALDAGFNIAMLFMFIIFSSGKVISMPHWWGNNAKSVERCFGLDE
ncbi:OPT superfamily oligopeptide transporter [Zopfia rhizophila CBS 207.26]|uniref:OPT superfamily oligopeptide transporter n=1 Tax=Zopfia rhizophila CBS 207.26 TaxID=1314779 RepID=A0A6A6EEN3_9PEZI|nr:OPT superfamily oligopeptide transporter [Zopfia rhizophila CBS 207.26]